MNTARLEHANITVKDPQHTASMLCTLFDWHIRWQGEALNGGFTVHVGEQDSYLALYTGDSNKGDVARAGEASSYVSINGLNHLGIVVNDLAHIEQRVVAAGFKPHSHGDYEPGIRFYFEDGDGLEIEVIQYT